jgi:hypothetical protein
MKRNRMWLSLIVVAGLLLAASVAQAQEGRVTIELTGIAAGIGVSWGSGTLVYRGKTYNFKVDGLSVGDVGMAKVTAVGKAYNLRNIADFAGNYAAVGAGAAVGGGAAALTMQNQRGVAMDLTATQAGVKFNIGPQGLTVTMR